MASAQPRLAAELARVVFHEPRIPVIANVTGLPHAGPADIPRLLVAQVTGSVRWEASIRHLLAQGFSRFIELGPGSALAGFMKRIDKTVQVLNVSNVPTLEATVQSLGAG